MNLYKRIILATLFTLSTLAASSQGIRFEYFGVSGVASQYGSLVFYGFGYEQNVGEKISLGLTYRKGYDITDGENSETESINYLSKTSDDVRINLLQSATWNEFSYSSKYHFTDNSDGGFYIANSLSLFNAKTIINITSIYVNGSSESNYDGVGTIAYERSITLLPLSIDLGYRSEFDGWYQDYYFGINFLPFGNNKTVQPSQLSDHGLTSKFNSLSFRFGMCFGIAW